jgi:hypothetical protein
MNVETNALTTARSFVREHRGFCEGTAFFCDGAEPLGLASRTGAWPPGAPMCFAAARGLASGQKNAVLRRGPLAAAAKFREFAAKPSEVAEAAAHP